jgi:putative oxidoreductase
MEKILGRYSPLIYALTRIIVGMMYWMHGTTKVFAFPPGSRRAVADLTSLVGVAGTLEIVLGALIIVGFLGSYAAFIASGEMAAAYFIAQFPYAVLPIHPAPGILAESAVFNCFFFLYVASKGSGILSVDEILRRKRSVAAPAVSL